MSLTLSKESELLLEELAGKFDLVNKWKDEGEKKGEMKLLMYQLNSRFGTIPDSLTRKLWQVDDLAVIEAIFKSTFDIQNIEDIERLIPVPSKES